MLRFSHLKILHRPRLNSLNGSTLIVLIVLFLILSIWFLSSRNSLSDSWMAYDQINKFYSNPYLSRPKLNPNQKFLVRDWSTYLGWNNNRYNIEAALLLAKLLDRTLVLPAFVYANSCEYPDQECAAVTPMFTSGVPVDLNQVSDKTWYPDPDPGKHTLTPPVPTHNWKGWVLPIEKMLDLDHIISTWGYAIKLDQFHKLTNPDPSFHSIGMNNGKWNLDFNRGLSYRMVPNAIFTNFSKHMVDRLPKPVTPLIDRSKPSKPAANSALIDLCESTLGRLEPNVHRKRTHLVSALSRSDQSQNQVIHKWDESLIRGDELNGVLSQADNPMLESCLASNNFRSFYAYNMSGWWMKAPYGRTKHVRRVENLLGWWDELHDFDEQILHIEVSVPKVHANNIMAKLYLLFSPSKYVSRLNKKPAHLLGRAS